MNGNIGQIWLEASKVFGFELAQCCADGGVGYWKN